MLYPTTTSTRSVTDLSGIWNIKLAKFEDIIDPTSPLEETMSIAVPASFNDQLVTKELRNHVGNIWYEREIMVPTYLADQRLVLRFGAVTHSCEVYVNGKLAAAHKGGFTPFEFEMTPFLKENNNRITVRVSNIIDYTTLPVGVYKEVEKDNKVVPTVSENFDFFNYAGIQRPVKMYTTPKDYIDDITVNYKVEERRANVSIVTKIVGNNNQVKVTIFDKQGNEIVTALGEDANLIIEDAHLWNPMASYLYTARVELFCDDKLVDMYEEPFGIRTIKVSQGQFLINDKPFYFTGFGKHEDTYIHGRGLNEPANVMDLNLMKWMGANSFRTSHYPYSEEMMRLADKEGFVVIDETPAVTLYSGFNVQFAKGEEPNTWDEMRTTEAHEQVIREMIQRDKNHACVVMWSIANEPATHQKGAYEYFKPLMELARSLDVQNRPLTIVHNMEGMPLDNLTNDLVDVLCLNRYYGWYIQTGDLVAAESALREEMEQWLTLDLNKPIMFTEYGADTIAGFHAIDDIPFTEEYQVKLYEMYHQVFDDYDIVVGEQLWNFADFETKIGTGRVQGNKKGVLTRSREPKMVVHSLKERWEDRFK